MIKVLIVEDDEAMLKSYKDVIDLFNSKTEEKIYATNAKNLGEAQNLLAKEYFDAAIIDLILEGGSRELNPQGNQIVQEILENLRFPVLIYSGNLGQLDPKFTENIFFKKYSRDATDFKTLLEEISKIHKTGITKILGRTGLIDKHLQEIFWKHLSQSLDYWFIDSNERILLRYVLAHLQEYLDLDVKTEEFDPYVPAEVYIVPPIKKFLFTGLILKKKTGDEYSIVVSPPCDLAQAKTKSVAVAGIEELGMPLVKEKKKILIEKTKGIKSEEDKLLCDKQAEAKDILLRLVSNSHAHKYHYLPPSRQFRGGFINFQRISTYSPEDLEKEFDFIASVTGGFCKDITARFSYYYSRQGQPDMNRDQLLVELMKII
jgi:hypothetical protein